MTTPEQVAERLKDSITEDTWNEILPFVESGAFDLDHIRRYFMAEDYWQLLTKNKGAVNKTLYQLAGDYNCDIKTIRYNALKYKCASKR